MGFPIRMNINSNETQVSITPASKLMMQRFGIDTIRVELNHNSNCNQITIICYDEVFDISDILRTFETKSPNYKNLFTPRYLQGKISSYFLDLNAYELTADEEIQLISDFVSSVSKVIPISDTFVSRWKNELKTLGFDALPSITDGLSKLSIFNHSDESESIETKSDEFTSTKSI